MYIKDKADEDPVDRYSSRNCISRRDIMTSCLSEQGRVLAAEANRQEMRAMTSVSDYYYYYYYYFYYPKQSDASDVNAFKRLLNRVDLFNYCRLCLNFLS